MMPSNLTTGDVEHYSSVYTNVDTSEDGQCYSNTIKIVVNIHSMFLVFFGFFANLCSFAVLIRPRLRRRPTFSYLAFLSLSNALLSLIYAVFAILAEYFDKTVEDLPLFPFCRLLNRFGIDFFTHFSLYTLTAVDLDRIRTVTAKTSSAQRYSRSHNERSRGCAPAFLHVCFVELFLALIMFIFNFHWLIAFGYVAPGSHGYPDRTKCHVPLLTNETMRNPLATAYDKYLTIILPYCELILFNIFPFLMSTFATIVILRHVSVKYTLLNNINKRLKKSRRRMELHLSILLISLNCVFILCNTPHTVFTVYASRLTRQRDFTSNNHDELCFLNTLKTCFDLLQQCYFMSTFFLYILTNRRFREEFYELLKRNLFLSCGIMKTSRASTPSSSRTRRHHHRHHHYRQQLGKDMEENDTEQSPPTRLLPTSAAIMETRFSVTDCFSQDAAADDDDEASTSKAFDTTEMRLSVNPTSFF